MDEKKKLLKDDELEKVAGGVGDIDIESYKIKDSTIPMGSYEKKPADQTLGGTIVIGSADGKLA